MSFFKELYNYRELLKSNVKKDIRGKYKGSFLGILWSFVNPLLMTLVYAMVFPFLMRSANYEHYTTFVVIGVLAWNWFTTSIAQGTYTVLGNAGIIKKVYFPREILPISVVTSGLVNYLISCIIIAIFLIASGIGFSKYLLFLPLIVITQYLLTLGIVFITSAINVYVRDFEYIVNFIIQMMFYATPILYSMDIFKGSKIADIIKLNPMATIMNSYKDIMYWQQAPMWGNLLIILGFSIMLCILGRLFFKKLAKGFAEEV
ncbi:MAG: ABC transporter permease [Bacilli bacterium]|nr:ABC transporter permease [Bacilli bacterium]